MSGQANFLNRGLACEWWHGWASRQDFFFHAALSD